MRWGRGELIHGAASEARVGEEMGRQEIQAESGWRQWWRCWMEKGDLGVRRYRVLGDLGD